MMNPYTGTDFFSFFITLLSRFKQLLPGREASLATDEVQLIVLICIALSSALTGSFLVLRRMTMLANALSHTILLGIIAAFVGYRNLSVHAEVFYLPVPLLLAASVITGLLTVYLTEVLNKRMGLKEDASIGIVFTTLFALGIVLVTLLTRSVHIGTEVVMGNADALHPDDIHLGFWVLLLNIVLVLLFFKEYLLTTFDSGLAGSLGISAAFFNYLLMTQAAVTTIGAFRAVGVLLVLALMTGPVLTARLLTHSVKHLILLACLFGTLAACFGVALARHMLSVQGMALSTSGLVVCVIIIEFLAVLLFKTVYIQQSKSVKGS